MACHILGRMSIVDYIKKSRKQRGRRSLESKMKWSKRLTQTLKGVGRNFGLFRPASER